MTALVELYNTDHQSLVAWICKEYGLGTGSSQIENVHRVRREMIATRLRLYRDQVAVPLAQVIDQIYETDAMRETLRKYVGVCVGQNVSRRIVNEVGSLYDRPALRALPDGAEHERFKAEEKRLDLHFIHQEGIRLTNLCNEVLLWQFKGIDDKNALRIVTPDAFDAIPDPRDRLVPAAYILDFEPSSLSPDKSKLPHWEVWDDKYRYRISGQGRMCDAHGNIVVVPEEHGLGRIPGVLFHRRQPTTCILDASYGEDIKSAHLAVALLDVMIMRLSKTQGENQPVLRGNLASMATGQVLNGERPLALPPEVFAEMLNMKTDPDHYLLVKRDRVTSVAQTYGMSYEQFTFQETADTSSGKAYTVRREKLTELRLEQRGRAMIHEGLVVDLLGFDSTGLTVDFQEQAIPQDASEEIDLLEKKMKRGLDSPISYVMRKDPEKTRDQAKAFVLENLADFAILIAASRTLNMSTGADAEDPGKTPEQNGAGNEPKGPAGKKPVGNDDDGESGAPAQLAS